MNNKEIYIDGVDVSGCNFTLERDGKIKCECTHATGFGVICDCESWKTCDYKNYKRKEQECEKLKNWVKNMMFDTDRRDWFEHFVECFENWKEDSFNQLDQLKAEIKSKTEYIQEQREIIDQYSKEIEMYKKCQGKRASKREEELKAKNEELEKEIINRNEKIEELRFSVSDLTNRLCDLNAKKSFRIVDLEQALTEIKEIAEECYYKCNSMNNCNISCKYYNDCNGEFSYLLAYLNKQICDEVNDG